jgi:hypothetical protein
MRKPRKHHSPHNKVTLAHPAHRLGQRTSGYTRMRPDPRPRLGAPLPQRTQSPPPGDGPHLQTLSQLKRNIPRNGKCNAKRGIADSWQSAAKHGRIEAEFSQPWLRTLLANPGSLNPVSG